MRIFVTGGGGFIGTHFIQKALRESPESSICNYDCAPPKLDSHGSFWIRGNILDRKHLSEVVARFRPTHVVHMAARTDSDAKTLADYEVNTTGSANVIAALAATDSIERTVFISSQYVAGPGPLPEDPWQHRPHTIYGESKCVMENLIRDANLPFTWVIARPTNVWGAWHPRYPREFWLVLKRGRYFHPGGAPVIRAYGYVGNVVDQIWSLMTIEPGLVNRKPFHLGDPVGDILEWTTAFSQALVGKKPRVVPRPFLRALAIIGDGARAAGIPFPLFSSRFRSMTEDYLVDMTPTFELLGKPRLSLEAGVLETVEWLKTQGKPWN